MNVFRRIARWIYRSAVDGRFVSKRYAEKHPDITTRERLP